MAYDNPHGLIAAAVIVQVLVLLMIGSRFMSHKMKGLEFHTSDYLIIVAGILSTALAIEQIYCAANGLFAVRVAPLQKANPAAAVDFLYTLRMHNYAFIVTGILAIGFIKTSVSFFYLQIFSVPKYRPYIIAWIVIMTLWTISFFTAFMAICGDHGIFSSRSHMNPAVQKRECGSTQMLDFGVLISGTVSDLITVLIPLPMIFSLLHLPMSDKVSIAAIFLVGLLSVGASAARSYIGIYTKFAPKDKIMDPGLGVTATCVWTLIEIQIGILAACAPTIRPVLRELVHNGLFGGLVSAASSIISRKSSRSRMQGSSNGSDRGHPQYEARLKGGADEEEIIQLHDMAGANSSRAEHMDGSEAPKPGAIHVSKGYTVGAGHE
ncbi:hypothetical protein DPSP01_013835 [Paraphaeosphaeria sporulosa]|uniref:Rhodopsin domain-containing protein n=1 Tax=Paraphaeosphaeria sporulosa TaxID=1460663 RepID=A0A177C5P4_9PLEO|nr:uncharacterized protein CC84DRAFT_1166561 [Paraphaeosphaeria sporulosa]OAG02746.1 hypothetical protein CC84DRAFT_1166561 [Paraphaeosphaeria sporulosa]